MIYRKLDSSGDYVFGSPNAFYYGTSAVAQAVYTSLKLLYGEWFEDTSQGLPLFDQILGRSGLQENIQSIDLIVTDYISQVQDVQSISDYISTYDSKKRQYSANCTVQTPYGDATIEITFP